jgi:hypothetical protein
VWKVEVATGAVEQVTAEDGVAAFELGPAPGGGTRLVFSRPGRPGIWETVSNRPAEVRLVIPSLAVTEHSNWGVVAAGVYYLGRAPRTQQLSLRLWNPGTGEDSLVVDLPWLPSSSTIFFSQDGKELVYSRLENLNADLVAVPLTSRGVLTTP